MTHVGIEMLCSRSSSTHTAMSTPPPLKSPCSVRSFLPLMRSRQSRPVNDEETTPARISDSRGFRSLLSVSPVSDITLILKKMEHGDEHAADELLAEVYAELRSLARAKMARESAGQTLQATALVHEAWLRLGGESQPRWENRAHFFGAAAEAMRRILVDNARRKQRDRHGGGLRRVDWANLNVAMVGDDDTVMAVHEALSRLAQHDPVGAKLIELRFFAGLPNVEAARVLGLAERTAKRTWAYARAWLQKELAETT